MRYNIFIVIIMLFCSCGKYTYRPEITTVVYDSKTGTPVPGAVVRFIQDTLTLGNTFGQENINLSESYVTDNEGRFKIRQIREKYWRESPYLSDLSWMLTVSCDDYYPDTLNLNGLWDAARSQIIVDTIRLIPVGERDRYRCVQE